MARRNNEVFTVKMQVLDVFTLKGVFPGDIYCSFWKRKRFGLQRHKWNDIISGKHIIGRMESQRANNKERGAKVSPAEEKPGGNRRPGEEKRTQEQIS
ncbi:hypothetical protein ACLK2E_15460 [Escherichia coli]